MTISKNLNSYLDCREAMDRALESPKGVRCTFGTKGMAVNFRQRCYNLRVVERERSEELYAPGDEMYGKSPYEGLTLTRTENIVEILNLGPAGEMKMEEITDA